MNIKWFSVLIIILSLFSCEGIVPPVAEIDDSYRLNKGINLTVILQNPLSSNENHRGDQFSTRLKESVTFKNHVILSKNTEIRGMVKRVDIFEKYGDQASLLLLFDQIVIQDSIRIPMLASLDTEKGAGVIKIKGQELKNVKIIGGSAVIGALIGNIALEEKGTEKGLIIGATIGAGAAILSNMKEAKLPQGTELVLELSESTLIPKQNTSGGKK